MFLLGKSIIIYFQEDWKKKMEYIHRIALVQAYAQILEHGQVIRAWCLNQHLPHNRLEVRHYLPYKATSPVTYAWHTDPKKGRGDEGSLWQYWSSRRNRIIVRKFKHSTWDCHQWGPTPHQNPYVLWKKLTLPKVSDFYRGRQKNR